VPVVVVAGFTAVDVLKLNAPKPPLLETAAVVEVVEAAEDAVRVLPVAPALDADEKPKPAVDPKPVEAAAAVAGEDAAADGKLKPDANESEEEGAEEREMPADEDGVPVVDPNVERPKRVDDDAWLGVDAELAAAAGVEVAAGVELKEKPESVLGVDAAAAAGVD
jgi:hypothetical protein